MAKRLSKASHLPLMAGLPAVVCTLPARDARVSNCNQLRSMSRRGLLLPLPASSNDCRPGGTATVTEMLGAAGCHHAMCQESVYQP